jgi:hypothetical protein
MYICMCIYMYINLIGLQEPEGEGQDFEFLDFTMLDDKEINANISRGEYMDV